MTERISHEEARSIIRDNWERQSPKNGLLRLGRYVDQQQALEADTVSRAEHEAAGEPVTAQELCDVSNDRYRWRQRAEAAEAQLTAARSAWEESEKEVRSALARAEEAERYASRLKETLGDWKVREIAELTTELAAANARVARLETALKVLATGFRAEGDDHWDEAARRAERALGAALSAAPQASTEQASPSPEACRLEALLTLHGVDGPDDMGIADYERAWVATGESAVNERRVELLARIARLAARARVGAPPSPAVGECGYLIRDGQTTIGACQRPHGHDGECQRTYNRPSPAVGGPEAKPRWLKLGVYVRERHSRGEPARVTDYDTLHQWVEVTGGARIDWDDCEVHNEPAQQRAGLCTGVSELPQPFAPSSPPQVAQREDPELVGRCARTVFHAGRFIRCAKPIGHNTCHVYDDQAEPPPPPLAPTPSPQVAPCNCTIERAKKPRQERAVKADARIAEGPTPRILAVTWKLPQRLNDGDDGGGNGEDNQGGA